MLHTDHMRTDSAYRDRLRLCNLDRVEHVLAHTSGRVAAWSRTTETLLVPSPDGEPGFYVKRYAYPNWNKRLRGTFRGTFFGKHRGQAEYRLLREMRSLGLPAIRPVAHGARRVGHFVQACFLITEEVPDACNLTTFAQRARAGQIDVPAMQRRLFIRELATQVARMHACGFAHGQLFWRNLLVRIAPTGYPEFFFLDVRPRHGGRRFTRASNWWIDELARLLASALPFTTRTERMRFLVGYFGAERFPPQIKRDIRRIDRLALEWQKHERQRIRMNELFDVWNDRLADEAPGPRLSIDPHETQPAESARDQA